jgi:hypothetical protein
MECAVCSRLPAVIEGAKIVPPPAFHVLPWRKLVDRTCARLDHNRQLSTDDERRCTTREVLIYMATI